MRWGSSIRGFPTWAAIPLIWPASVATVSAVTSAIVDTGPLVGLLDGAERHHQWAVERVRELQAPLLVCEPVLVETLFVLASHPTAREQVFRLIAKKALQIAFQIDEHAGALDKLLQKYRDVPMSLA